MKKPATVKSLEDLGRTRLSPSFFLRDFLHSEIANLYGMPNIPDDPDLAIDVGTHLCMEILEPLQQRFGRVAIRSAFRSCTVNQFGNENGHNCARNAFNIGWHERPQRRIDSYIKPKGTLTKPGMENHEAHHAQHYEGFMT
jgi:hypothetical protein